MKNTLKLSLMAMYAAISVLAIIFIRIPIIPATPFLVYDMADIPIILATLTLGLPAGILVLLAVCLIQAFLLGGDQWVGLVMHFVSTGAMVVIFSAICQHKPTIPRLIISAAAATIAMTAVMIPLNLIFTGIFMGAGTQAVIGMLIPAIIPFNLLKAGINSAVTFAVFLPISKVLKKYVKDADKE